MLKLGTRNKHMLYFEYIHLLKIQPPKILREKVALY